MEYGKYSICAQYISHDDDDDNDDEKFNPYED